MQSAERHCSPADAIGLSTANQAPRRLTRVAPAFMRGCRGGRTVEACKNHEAKTPRYDHAVLEFHPCAPSHPRCWRMLQASPRISRAFASQKLRLMLPRLTSSTRRPCCLRQTCWPIPRSTPSLGTAPPQVGSVRRVTGASALARARVRWNWRPRCSGRPCSSPCLRGLGQSSPRPVEH
jgi:hypothetical protein